ncbi:MAG: dethiobiotin synthase [Magnetococcales bacterium]|nr:dethiobiotin synthase [Magnetococcales bacterium]
MSRSDPAPGLFVTGTDTGVGKSVAAAWLAARLAACYWKPVQSGLEEESDSQCVARLAGLEAAAVLPETYRLHMPLSPHESARRDGVEIQLSAFVLPDGQGRPVVVEGAGGVLVPLNGREKMIDLMVQLALPVVVVARTTLGTINHTLLTLEALRRRELEVAGVILCGVPNGVNREAIVGFGGVTLLAEIPWLDPVNRESLAAVAPADPTLWDAFRRRFDE